MSLVCIIGKFGLKSRIVGLHQTYQPTYPPNDRSDVIEIEIDKVLAKGALQAREITVPILKKTYEIVGMVGR